MSKMVRRMAGVCPRQRLHTLELYLTIALLAGCAVLPVQQARADNQKADCLACHSDPTLSTEKDGKQLPLYVDETAFDASVHGGLECVSCHTDLAQAELPHPSPLQPVDCSGCHGAQQDEYAESLHGRALARGDELAPRCATCHGSHAIAPVASEDSAVAPLRIPFLCGSCHSEGAPVQMQRNIHQDHILDNYSESIHGEGLFKKGLSVSATCVSCHGSHQILPHTDPRSSIAKENVARTCAKCHTQIEKVHRKVIDGVVWEKQRNRMPVCVECHQPHKVRKVFYDQGTADKDCLMCHARADLHSADGRPMQVSADQLKGSMHAKLSCAQCHTQVTPSKTRACETITDPVNCAMCHSGQVNDYRRSIHGRLRADNSPDAPNCADCHGTHGVLGKTDPNSPTYFLNVPDLCGECHREHGRAAVRYTGTQRQVTENYAESIHGKGLRKSGLVSTPTCSSCHTSHRALPANDPASSVNRANLAATCGRCHQGVYKEFNTSVHAPTAAVANAVEKLPVCEDCHTAHTIKRTDGNEFRLGVMQVCGRCHIKIAATYFETFHGKASQLGDAKTAKCEDCHGAHNIRRTTDPQSNLHRKNILTTCQKCHPGATRRFAGYLTHATHHDPDKYPWIFFTFWGMTALLVGTFVVSGIHTLLWLPRSLQMRRAHPPRDYNPEERQFVRFSLLHRCLHIVMVISFLTLAATGMTLKFSYTGWAVTLSQLLGGPGVTSVLHRIGAVLLAAVFLTHLWDLWRRKNTEFGSWRALIFGPDTMLFTLRDAREVWETLKWYVGRGPRPRYGRWTYWEKFDYFAVFWGIFVIGLSGLMLWFPEAFTRLLPGWLINVATIVHSDEALLAAGFIFTIHFFNTHFRPEKFPMDIVVFTGRMPVDELERDKPDEYARLTAGGQLEQRLAPPLHPTLVRAIRVFGWCALIIGLGLVVGIIYAMLFAYR